MGLFKKAKKENNIDNLLLINGVPKKEYTELLNIADVGMVFLDYRFTIPNFPSRLLSYCEKGIPVVCCTDKATDIGDIVERNGFGWKCYSDNVPKFTTLLRKISQHTHDELKQIGQKAWNHLNTDYSSEKIVKILYKGGE